MLFVNRKKYGKFTGTISVKDGDVKITCDLPKRVNWDQNTLAEIVDKLQQQGKNISEYVEVKYNIPEPRYTAWPSNIRAVFEPARQLNLGKPVYKFSILREGEQLLVFLLLQKNKGTLSCAA